MKTQEQSKFWWRTSVLVKTYAFFLMIIVALQALICMCAKYNFTFNNIAFADFINGNLQLPISNMAWIWCAVCAAYCGVDRTSYALKTAQLESGQTDFGDPHSLRVIILLSAILFIEAIVCNGAVDAEFDLNAFSSAFGSSVLLYVVGQKAIKTVKYVNGKIDANGNGIADEDEGLALKSDPIVHEIGRTKTEEEQAYDRIKDAMTKGDDVDALKDVAVDAIKGVMKSKK